MLLLRPVSMRDNSRLSIEINPVPCDIPYNMIATVEYVHNMNSQIIILLTHPQPQGETRGSLDSFLS